MLADPGGPAAAAVAGRPDRNAATGLRQLDETLRKNPLLHSIDQMWNANPLREVVPLDWAGDRPGVAHRVAALARQSGRRHVLLAELNAKRLAIRDRDVERGGQALVGLGGRSGGRPAGAATSVSPPRNGRAIPPTARCSDLYLLASDWLLRQSAEAADLDPAERQRLDFHLRQFVDAMSPTLQLMSNPAALRRAIETGGASLADGARNLLPT